MAPSEFAGRKTYLEDLIRLVGVDVTDCGGKSKCRGFPILTANEANSLPMASDHTSEAKGKGADCMVTPCPLCHLSLDGNQPNAEKETKRQIGLPILHLPQLVGLALGFDEQEMELQRHIVPTELVVHLNDFEGQRLLRRSAPRNDISLCHCERSEAISVSLQSPSPVTINAMKH